MSYIFLVRRHAFFFLNIALSQAGMRYIEHDH